MIMNEMNELETLLRSWELRRPSPRVKARLFGAAQVEEERGIAAASRETPESPQGFGLFPPNALGASANQNAGALAEVIRAVVVMVHSFQGKAGRLSSVGFRWLAPAM